MSDVNTNENNIVSSTEAGNLEYRKSLASRKRIVVKVGSSSLLHPETGRLDYHRIDRLCRELSDLKNQGREVILVSSGAIAVGREAVGPETLKKEGSSVTIKQALSSIGQARLMMIYQKSFEDYNQMTGQVLMTKYTVSDNLSKYHLRNTFSELLKLGVIPIVNENDSVATFEISVGDNDNLSAMVASLVGADLLILLSDVDGLYTDDPRVNPDAKFIEFVPHLDHDMMKMGKTSTGSGVGTGGMHAKLSAAHIATSSGCDMVIVNSARGMGVIHDVTAGKNVGTLFKADENELFDLQDYVDDLN
ncbi:MAG: glutamate 5-kinase [Lachnospiraceae bacterium]|nr:glutamate 5-kinase [Lachnospiraceae bacterium]